MYIVPEGDPESVPLCVNISVEITEPITYTIESFHKSPAEAEGKKIVHFTSYLTDLFFFRF